VGRCERTRRRRIPLHPCSDQDLIDAVQLGLTRDRARRQTEKDLRALKARFESLSAREREIMIRVVQGRLNKQIADDISIAEPTVKVRRSNLMRKMNVHTPAELGRMAEKLELLSEKV
jgi:FixJ family two-component response regulator